MIKKLSIFITSIMAGVFLLRASEAFWRHEWWIVAWELGLTIGWSAVAWHHLRRLG